MPEQSNNPDRLESMLRTWGAEEAARTDNAPLPALTPPRRPPRPRPATRLLRWAPALAAGVLLAASIVLYTEAHRPGREAQVVFRPATRPAAKDPAVVDESLRRLALARRRIRRLEGRTDALAQRLDEAGERTRAAAAARKRDAEQLATLRKQVEKLSGARERAGELESELADARTQLAVTKKQHAEVAGDLKEARTALAEAKDALGGLDLTRRKLAAAGAELASVQGELERQRKARREAELSVARLQGKIEQLEQDYQRRYLAESSARTRPVLRRGGRRAVELARRQDTLEDRKLLQRLAAVRKALRGRPGAMAVERAELVLTRLEMLDTEDPRAVRSFGKLLERLKPAAQIDRVLDTGEESSLVRSWLLEAKLLLKGIPADA